MFDGSIFLGFLGFWASFAGLFVTLLLGLFPKAKPRNRCFGSLVAIATATVLTLSMAALFSALLSNRYELAGRTFLNVVKRNFCVGLDRVRIDLQRDFRWDRESAKELAKRTEVYVEDFNVDLTTGRQVFVVILDARALRENLQGMADSVTAVRGEVLQPLRAVAEATSPPAALDQARGAILQSIEKFLGNGNTKS